MTVRKTRKLQKLGQLRSSYGEMLLKKGTILYHCSDFPNPDISYKPMIFLTFHPSDWSAKYVTFVSLKKDISLFFMVSAINNLRVYSLLDKLIGQNDTNLVKQYDDNLKCFIPYLQAEKFDGWFSTIENKTDVEVALINSTDNYEFIHSERLLRNWVNGSYVEERRFIPKRWGNRYERCKTTTLTINKRFKPMIESYVKNIDEKCPDEFTLDLILKNSKIKYINAEEQKIIWNCNLFLE